MEGVFTNSYYLCYPRKMTTTKLIVLSYHRFGNEESNYVFSRTYKQFKHDLETKDFDWITIDDGSSCLIKACKMMEERNIRAKIFIATALVGKPGYCSWDELWAVSKKHDIENHSHRHVRLIELGADQEIFSEIKQAQELIKANIGRWPRYFAAPWNQYDMRVTMAAGKLNLQPLMDRINIKNDSR